MSSTRTHQTRTYDLEIETKEYLKACKAKSIVNQTNIKTLNDYVINRKTRNLNASFLANSPIVLNGLVLWLDAGVSDSYPTVGTIWKDLAGSNNGTLINGPTFSSVNAGSIVFDGSDDIANTTYVSANTYTFSAWFKTNVVSNGYRNIISIPTPNYSLVLLDDDSPNLGFWTNDSLNGQSLSTPTISTNTWYNIVFVREGNNTTGGYKAYLNGVLYGNANTGTWSSTANLSVGGRTDSAQFLNGNISQVYIYNRALNSAEILQNYNATKGRFGL